jgi:transcriptional regulator with XRE-family HTH domain
MISAEQIRAARALLDWSTSDLAKQAGLTVNGINKIERGHVQAHRDTLEKLRGIFEIAGIEFIGNRGAALRHESYELLEGPGCYLRLLDNVYHTLRGKPGTEILSICTDDSVSPPEVVQAIQRWHDAKIKCRFLSHEKATRFDFPLEEYRLISSQYFKNSVMVVYADKVATLRGTNSAVLIVHDKDQADMLRGLFEMIWVQSLMPKGNA